VTIKIKLLLIGSRIFILLAREVELFRKIAALNFSKQGSIVESICCDCFTLILQVLRTLTVAELFLTHLCRGVEAGLKQLECRKFKRTSVLTVLYT